MAIRISTPRRNEVADAYVADLDTLDIYTGSQPASAQDAATGTLLGTITAITWGAGASGAVSVTGSTADPSADATGTAGWGRFRSSADGTHKVDGAVGAEFTLADASVISGGTVSLTSATITVPASG